MSNKMKRNHYKNHKYTSNSKEINPKYLKIKKLINHLHYGKHERENMFNLLSNDYFELLKTPIIFIMINILCFFFNLK